MKFSPFNIYRNIAYRQFYWKFAQNMPASLNPLESLLPPRAPYSYVTAYCEICGSPHRTNGLALCSPSKLSEILWKCLILLSFWSHYYAVLYSRPIFTVLFIKNLCKSLAKLVTHYIRYAILRTHGSLNVSLHQWILNIIIINIISVTNLVYIVA